MAAASPASSSKRGDDSSTPLFNGNNNANNTNNNIINNNNINSAFEMPRPTSLRGLNKPKCVKCGNVARSRCPFQSCKSCCSIAQNPCHIHVLDVKKNSTLPDKTSNNGASNSIEQLSKDSSNSSSNASWRLNSLRQLSARHLEFLRARKSLAKKDTGQINKWRLTKLRENIESNIQTENESFERYIQNISYLEEIFKIPQNVPLIPSPNIKLGLKSNPEKSVKKKEKLKEFVDNKLKELSEISFEKKEGPERKSGRINDLIEKLSKARNEEDLKSCFEIRVKIFDKSEGRDCNFAQNNKKVCINVPVDEEILGKIGTEFDKIDEIIQL